MNQAAARFVCMASGILVMLAIGLNACTMEQKHHAMAEDLIATAKTKSDHEAIAAHYEQQADDALNKAEQMRNHLEGYESGTITMIPRQKDAFIQHCEALISRYNEIAEENQALAKLHYEIAEGL